MSKIVTVNLTDKSVIQEDYAIEETGHYGRGLAVYLIEKYVPSYADRLDPDNAIVMVPGLFVGNKAPSSCRMTIATKRGIDCGIQVSNVTGSVPQKLASPGIIALIILGKSNSPNTVVHISDNGIEILEMNELDGMKTSDTVNHLKKRFGRDMAALGTGPSADALLPLSTFFCTYPDGIPEYYCPRSGFGDVPGSKGFKALVINCRSYFSAECRESYGFFKASKELSKIIVSDDVCGRAMPQYGSMTIMKFLKDGEVPDVKDASLSEKCHVSVKGRVNFCCAPMCVVGCLNRHCTNDGQIYDAPEQSEVKSALLNCFNIDNDLFLKKLNSAAFDIDVDPVEFLFSANVYFKAINQNAGEYELLSLISEIENLTLLGRVIAGRSAQVYRLFSDVNGIKRLVTRESIHEEKDFSVKMDRLSSENSVDDVELLYRQIFVLENLGLCIFTSFALLNDPKAMQLISDMFSYKTGVTTSPKELMDYAAKCIEMEMKFHRGNAVSAVKKNVPTFTRVLYRYFSSTRNT